MATSVVVIGLLAACAADDEPAAAPPATFQVSVPRTVDEICEDPVGDLSVDPVVQGTASEPAGIDLVLAEAHLTDESFEASFTTNGDIASVPGASFVVFQGPVGLQTSWELRMERAAGGWATTLVTYATGSGRIEVDQVERAILADVVVDGDNLSVTLPRSTVPPPLTLAWAFGASTDPEDPDAEPADTGGSGDETQPTVEPELDTTDLFDDCLTLADTDADDGGEGDAGGGTTVPAAPPGAEGSTGSTTPGG